jgi:hypothetical protein
MPRTRAETWCSLIHSEVSVATWQHTVTKTRFINHTARHKCQAFAAGFLKRGLPLHILVHNGGRHGAYTT